MRKLYTFFRSSTSYRLRIALALKGLEWEPHFTSLPKMEHRAEGYMGINPQGLLPALVEDDGVTVTQSIAMMEYLDEVYPEPPLLPKHAAERAYVRALCDICACDVHPLNNVRVLKYLGARWKLGEDDVNEWYRHWMAEGMRSFEATLTQSGKSGRYCFGDSVTMADICLVPQIANAKRFNCDLTAYPKSVAVAAAADELAAFKAAAPSTQADAF